MHDLLYVAIGMIILLIVIFIISLLAKERMVEESEVKDVFIRKYDDNEISIKEAMKNLELRNSIKS